MVASRREIAQGTAGLAAWAVPAGAAPREERRKAVSMVHLSVSEDALDAEPIPLERARDAGVSAVWVTGLGMFDDASFGSVKNRTVELFSAQFHRWYAEPELAYSESTAYPADRLSPRNMAAKLAVSTIADVRNTMYMSGLTAFPRGHWDVLGPAMRKHAAIHAKLAGHRPRGPVKHYHGMASRSGYRAGARNGR